LSHRINFFEKLALAAESDREPAQSAPCSKPAIPSKRFALFQEARLKFENLDFAHLKVSKNFVECKESLIQILFDLVGD
jgi:hypothetical protein